MHHVAKKGMADVASVMLAKDRKSLKIKDKSGNLLIHYLGWPACEVMFTSTESISVSTTTTSAEPEETLYLRNGDFDESYDASPWYSALDVANLLMGVVSGVSHDGGQSLRLKFASRPLYFLANLLNPKALIAEQDYEISVWARFGKEVDDNGEGCTELFIWCMHSEWSFAEKGGDGQLLASADSVNDFVQVKATCRWSQEQLDKNPLLMLRWTCSKTLGWVDSITIEKAGQ
ncbi:hypothetical protein CDV36_015798 [Fusarium kuroshium]|uniref:Uncharacterized protein n=1 Tax=Fusarium kuroshium TaxID=2010991 RepID=A0A3M2R851_9HYPO|nr:hypothetical protein CDV36_015798 [Fusarium kuroshium]